MIPAVAAVFIKEDFMQNKKQEWRPGNMLYPVPAVMVSCQRENEKPNIITVAWAGTICSDPVMLSISVRKERYSHRIISETKEICCQSYNKGFMPCNRLLRSAFGKRC